MGPTDSAVVAEQLSRFTLAVADAQALAFARESFDAVRAHFSARNAA